MSHPSLVISMTVLLLVWSFPAQSQEPTTGGGLDQDATTATRKKAIGLLESVADQFGSLRSAENRARIGSNVADSLWNHDQRRSRSIFAAIEEDIKAGFNDTDSADPAHRQTLMVFAQLRSEIIDRIAKRDPELAMEFLQATVPPMESQQPYQMRDYENNLALRLARQTAARNPQLALKIGRQTLAKGLSTELLSVLYQLQRTDDSAFRALYREIADKIKTTNLSRNWMELDVAVQLVRSFQPPQADEGVYRDLIDVLLTTALASDCGNAERSNTQRACYIVGWVFSRIEKYYPVRAAPLKRYAGDAHETNAAISEGLAQINDSSQNGTVDEILSLRTRYPDLQIQIHWAALRKALNAGDVTRARQIASDSPDQEARRAMLTQIDREQVRTSMDAEKLALIQQELSRLRRDEERIPLLLFAASSIGGSDRKAALELLNQAAEIVNSTKSLRTQLDGQLALATIYCNLKSDRGFTIMESLLPRLNELVAATTTLGGLENNYFSDGEWNMSSGGPVGALLTRLAHNAGSFARMDFDRSVALSNQFERYEIRVMAQLKIAQSLLGDQPKPAPLYPRQFFPSH
jgi:hypothetical protein